MGKDYHNELLTSRLYGPIRVRSCTDVFCLLLFLAFWAFCIYTFILGKSQGNLSKIARPNDADAVPCGVNFNGKDLTNFPFLYFNLNAESLSPSQSPIEYSLCVSKCPESSDDTFEFFPTELQPIGTQPVVYDTLKIWNRFCMPIDEKLYSLFSKSFYGVNVQSVYESVAQYWDEMLIVIGVAIVLCFLYSKLLGFCAAIIVFVTIVLMFGVLIAGSVLAWNRKKALEQEAVGTAAAQQEEMLKEAGYYKWGAIVLWTVTSILFLVICCLMDRIKMAVKVIKAAGDFVNEVKVIVLVPILMYVVILGYFGWWVYSTIHVYSLGTEYFEESYPFSFIRLEDAKMK